MTYSLCTLMLSQVIHENAQKIAFKPCGFLLNPTQFQLSKHKITSSPQIKQSQTGCNFFTITANRLRYIFLAHHHFVP